ncbi:MAG: hypothetical protein R3F19_09170 [Verrucomicrobiales bacterium]
MMAFATTGYLTFVKVLEVGGILVAIPMTRRAGLLVLGPIIINILAYHTFITRGEGVLSPVILVIVALTLFLVWVERKASRIPAAAVTRSRSFENLTPARIDVIVPFAPE